MAVVPVVRQHEIRLCLLQRLERFLDLRLEGKEPVPKAVDLDARSGRSLEKQGRTAPCFPRPLARGGEHHPIHFDPPSALQQREDQPAAADLDVVGMRADTQYTQGAAAPCE